MKFLLRLCALALLTGLPLSVQASSGDAWEDFRNDVAAACRAALELSEETPIMVELFGSESYGFAIAEGEEGPLVCVYDKQTKEVETGTQFEERE